MSPHCTECGLPWPFPLERGLCINCRNAQDLEHAQARIRQLEAELNQPKHLRWQAPINRETP